WWVHWPKADARHERRWRVLRKYSNCLVWVFRVAYPEGRRLWRPVWGLPLGRGILLLKARGPVHLWSEQDWVHGQSIHFHQRHGGGRQWFWGHVGVRHLPQPQYPARCWERWVYSSVCWRDELRGYIHQCHPASILLGCRGRDLPQHAGLYGH